MTQKWNLQDIRPAGGRTTRPQVNQAPLRPSPHSDIRPQARPTPPRPQAPSEASVESEDFTDFEPITITDGNKRSRSIIYIAVAIFVVIVGGSLAISVATGGATVYVTPKHKELTVNAEFTAYKEKKAGELSYEILTIESTKEKQVKAEGQETVETQAVGEIEIIKTTPGAERLIKNTRFATADGKVYRIQESVVVPGSLKNSAGENVPGKIRAEVFSVETGEEYNLLVDTKFTIPGFKENNMPELYNAITAVNTSAFTGGYAGQRFIINETELATARQTLQQDLRNELLEKIKNSKPAGFTTFENSIAITYNQLPAVQYDGSSAIIREQAILQMPLFVEAEFASYIAKATVVGYESKEGVRIDNIEKLSFAYSDAKTATENIANPPSLTFKIIGSPKIVWTYDAKAIQTNLIDKEKTAHVGVLGAYPGIESTKIEIRPFWSRSFPSKAEQIEIIEVLSTESGS